MLNAFVGLADGGYIEFGGLCSGRLVDSDGAEVERLTTTLNVKNGFVEVKDICRGTVATSTVRRDRLDG